MSRSRRVRKRLSFERLETRWLMANVALVEQKYREDDFSIAGTYTYRLHEPAEFDYIDAINNGTYSSSSGHVTWTSPKDGKGFFQGKALGDGRDTVDFAGRRDCSEYGIDDVGKFNFTLDAQLSSMRIDRTETISSIYTYYRDLTGGFCEQPEEPWSRFFGGRSSLYIGTFSAADHKASLRYVDDSPEIVVDSPKADVKWTNVAATDLEVSATPVFGDIELPEGWELIGQDSERPNNLNFVDVDSGGIDVVVDVRGKPIRTSNVLQPIARVKLFWASSATDLTGAEIPVVATTNPVGVYWNSSQMHAVIDQLPDAPDSATHIRITVELDSGADAIPANNSTFLPIGKFEARNDITGPVGEDDFFDGTSSSILHLADSTNPDIKVLGYKLESALGAPVAIVDDTGAYSYLPTGSEAIQALAPNETVNDTISFLAIKYQALIDEASHVITVVGANDDPLAEVDEKQTTNYQSLTVPSSFLLANDTDIDHGDRLTVSTVETTSSAGANVRVVWNASNTEITEIVYEPATSSSLRQMNEGDQFDDAVNYEIVDRYGGTGFGTLLIHVIGEARRLAISEVTNQMTVMDVPTLPLYFYLDDPDGDPADVTLSATATNTALVPAAGFQFDGTDGTRLLTVTPAPGATGRTQITVTASTHHGGSASTTFSLVVGTVTDGDLDGVSNEEEDAAPNGGDMNLDGQPDSSQPNVASLRAHRGNAFVNVAVAPERILEAVFAEDSATAAGAAATAQMPIGQIHYEVLVNTPGETATVIFRSDYATSPLNRYFQHDGGTDAASWHSLMHNKGDGARIYPDRIELVVRDGGRADQASADNTRIIGDAVLANVAFPWRNIVREDIDNDGIVVPFDVLALINQLNLGGARQLGVMPSQGDFIPYFVDPSGSNSLEPIDVLIVINFLNQRSAQGGEGESSARSESDTVFAGLPTLSLDGAITSTTTASKQRTVAIETPQYAARNPQWLATKTAGARQKSGLTSRDKYVDALDSLLADDLSWQGNWIDLEN